MPRARGSCCVRRHVPGTLPPALRGLYLGLVTGLRPSTLRPLRRRAPECDVLEDEGRLLVRRSHSLDEEAMLTTKQAEGRHRPPARGNGGAPRARRDPAHDAGSGGLGPPLPANHTRLPRRRCSTSLSPRPPPSAASRSTSRSALRPGERPATRARSSASSRCSCSSTTRRCGAEQRAALAKFIPSSTALPRPPAEVVRDLAEVGTTTNGPSTEALDPLVFTAFL